MCGIFGVVSKNHKKLDRAACNRALIYLGDFKVFIVFDFIEISKEIFNKQKLSRETEWKLINMEHFLRHSLNNIL